MISSFHYKAERGASPASFALGVNGLLLAAGAISLISADVFVGSDDGGDNNYEFTMQYRAGGLAAYQADVRSFNPNLGTTFAAQVDALLAAQATTLFPVLCYDLTSPATRSTAVAVMIISEVVTAANDGSYAVGNQEFTTGHGHIVEALEDIVAGASGDVRLYSPSGRYRDTTATNMGAVTLATGSRALAIFDPITQGLWFYPTCC